MKTIEEVVRLHRGVWPFNSGYDAVYWDRTLSCSAAYLTPYSVKICTREEFEQCARRLRNEPSWDDAPDWAVSLAQDSDGSWYWYESSVYPCGHEWGDPHKCKRIRYACDGEVIGDWRDTLRLRPDDEKVEDKSDWHTRCELPPIGTMVSYLTGQGVLLLPPDAAGLVVVQELKGGASGRYKRVAMHAIRPLPDERERWIAAAQQAIGCEPNAHRHMLGQLYDAGLAKMPEGE